MSKVKKVFLSFPMNGKTKAEMEASKKYMIAAFESMYPNGEFEYISNDTFPMSDKVFKKIGENERAVSMWYLGEAIKKIGECDILLAHPEWSIARGCKIEVEAAHVYNVGTDAEHMMPVFLLDVFSSCLNQCIDAYTCGNERYKKLGSKIIALMYREHIWTMKQFMNLTEEDINEFSKISGVGEKTVEAIRYILNGLLREEEAEEEIDEK